MKTTRPVSSMDRARMLAKYPQVFRPDWRRRLLWSLLLCSSMALLLTALATFEVSWRQLSSGMGRMAGFVSLMWPPLPSGGTQAMLYLKGLAESVAIAFLGTLLAAALAFPFAFLAAKNVFPNIFVHFASRRAFDGIRSIDTLIWALIWVGVVGLGPFAGVLAIVCADFGVFGKLFSEAIEASEQGPVDGVRCAGGNELEAIRFGLLPQVLPVMASQILYFFESNTRSATIIGIVGAGGIGLYLTEVIRSLEWASVAFIVLMILVAVTLIDQISTRLRNALIRGPVASSD